MEDHNKSTSTPQFYLLSEESYEELRSIQTMLMMMAEAVGNDDESEPTKVLVMRRARLRFYFEEVSYQIGDALERLALENGIGRPNRKWQ
jgi:hypothetical protein